MTIESTVFYITNDFGDSVEVSGGAYDAWLSNPYDGFASASGIAPGGYEKFSISNEKGEDYAGNFQTVVTGIQGYNQGIDQGQQIYQIGPSSAIDDQERMDRGPGVLGLGQLRLTSIDIVQDVSYPGGDDTNTSLSADIKPAVTDNNQTVASFSGYGEYPGNDAFGGLTIAESAALDQTISQLGSSFGTNVYESKTSIQNAVSASLQAAELIDYFGDKLTTADRQDLESIVAVGRGISQTVQDVQNIVGGAIESLSQINLYNEDRSPNEIARSIRDQAYAVYDALSKDERRVLSALFPELDQQLGALQTLSGSGNPFANPDKFQPAPYTAQSEQPFNSTQAEVDRLVSAFIAENGSITDTQYAAIEQRVIEQRQLNQESITDDSFYYGEGGIKNQRGWDILKTNTTVDSDPSLGTVSFQNEVIETNTTVEPDPSLPETLFFDDEVIETNTTVEPDPALPGTLRFEEGDEEEINSQSSTVVPPEAVDPKDEEEPVTPQKQLQLSNAAPGDWPQYTYSTNPLFEDIDFPSYASAVDQPPVISFNTNGLPSSWFRDDSNYEFLGTDTQYPINVTWVDRVHTWFTTKEQSALGSKIIEIIYESIKDGTNPKSQLDVLNDANNGFVTQYLNAIGFNAGPLTGSAAYTVLEVAPGTTASPVSTTLSSTATNADTAVSEAARKTAQGTQVGIDTLVTSNTTVVSEREANRAAAAALFASITSASTTNTGADPTANQGSQRNALSSLFDDGLLNSNTSVLRTGSNLTDYGNLFDQDNQDQVDTGDIDTGPDDLPPGDIYQYTIGPDGSTPYDDDGNLNPGWAINDETGDPYYAGTSINTNPNPVSDSIYRYPTGPDGSTPYDDDGNLNPGWALDENGDPVYVGPDYIDPSLAESAQASREYAQKVLAQQQATLAAQRKLINNGDWRVRLSLAPGATYLYNTPGDNSAGILEPLRSTNGVIFPYTPQIDVGYRADYDAYNLTHSNYRGYFYKSSYVDQVSMRATFTAQDTFEAEYLLAVIHFFRSVTKMFYGQDPERGAPPPLVYLTGLGQYQFSAHPCVVTSFTYTLPPDVDYIRARSKNISYSNLLQRRDRQSIPVNPLSGALQRLFNAGATKGAIPETPAPPTLGLNNPTYVPTKMDIIISLYPIQSRSQVSKQFSLKQFANGNLLKGGFW